ncbi:MAG: hypothetical protein R3231_05205 [bacterium]|nr:hypothetical protein [bacterium]
MPTMDGTGCDDSPPDELNRAPAAGLHFGFPYCHGGEVEDPDYGGHRGCQGFSAPAMKLGSRVPSLGIRVYDGAMFPAVYRHQFFIAEHGSWNRTVPIGYRITLVRLTCGQPSVYAVFAEGWLQGREVTGRPVDLLVMPGGSLLVSDDHAGAIYRISDGR